MAATSRHRQTIRLLAAALATALLVALAPAVAASTGRWVVPADLPLPTGATVVGAFPLADALIVTASGDVPGGVSYDAPIPMQSLPAGVDPATGLRVDSGVAATGAPQLWDTGELGGSAVVALIDTGVAPVPGLEDTVVGEIDFSGSGGGDGYGHGTFLASLIANSGEVAPGVAPQAGILSLKVGDNEGATTLGAVLSALQWLDQVGRVAGVRVATMALGADSDSDAARLLDMAADAVARAGVLVVTASGNDGEGKLTSPATATSTFSVGAFDDAGTASRHDDTPAAFSGSGLDRAGVMQPDGTSSGVSVVAAMPAGAAIAAQHPQGRVEDGLFRGSGTSMATALTAGVAALASSARPDLDGHGLAEALRSGGGASDAPATVAAAQAAPAGPELPRPAWADKVADRPGNVNRQAQGVGSGTTVDAQGLRWTGLRWTGLRWTGLRWTGLRWTGLRWTGLRWTDGHWGDSTWAPGAWSGLRWTGSGWAGEDVDPKLTGLRWTGVSWTGVSWTGLRWTGLRWTGLRWTGLRWTMLQAPTPTP